MIKNSLWSKGLKKAFANTLYTRYVAKSLVLAHFIFLSITFSHIQNPSLRIGSFSLYRNSNYNLLLLFNP